MEAPSNRWRAWIVSLVLVAGTVLLYEPVRSHDFVDYDDHEYVVENHHVTGGLSLEGLVWAFTQPHSANWHPLTYLSHMVDCEIFGLDAGSHLMVNAVLHSVSAALLFLFLWRTTGGFWQSAFVAAIYAWHPLRVESVAWVSERKDVLSAVFFMLTLLAYAAYVGAPSPARFGLVTLAYALGLMSKPMLVTLPFVLLLLDLWPLRRWGPGAGGQGPVIGPQTLFPGPRPPVPGPGLPGLLLEKAPLLLLAVASSAVTVLVQRLWGAMVPIEAFGLAYRVQNAIVAYAAYLWDSVWPAGLAVLYPIRNPLPPAEVGLAAAVLLAISAAVLWLRRPYMLVGWLWYLGVLVPVIGIVWVGEQSRADRFTYLPQIGLWIMVAWGLPELLGNGRRRRMALAVAAVVALVASAAVTRAQVAHWRDGETLFRRAVDVTTGNYVMHASLGAELAKNGSRDEAREHYAEALRLKPDFARAHLRLGVLLAEEGRTDEAVERYELVMRLRPDYSTAPFNLGLAMASRGRTEEAIRLFEQALAIEPDYPKAHVALALALEKSGRRAEAAGHLRAALAIKPEMVEAHGNLAIALEALGQPDEALLHYRETVRLAPGDVRARVNLAAVLEGAGQFDEARAEYQEALRLKPGLPEAVDGLARLDGARGSAAHAARSAALQGADPKSEAAR